MNLSSLYKAIVFEPNIAGTLQIENEIAVFTPNGNLVGGTTYHVTITVEAEDLAGNKMEENYTFEFTTQEPKITTAAPFAFDVLVFWIFFIAILIIVILVLYEFILKKKLKEKSKEESKELEMPEEEEPEDLDFEEGKDDIPPSEVEKGTYEEAEDIEDESYREAEEEDEYEEKTNYEGEREDELEDEKGEETGEGVDGGEDESEDILDDFLKSIEGE
jgi:flagellar biosynthesis/type III secretory pathway M-ring protein FliF/YscJ